MPVSGPDELAPVLVRRLKRDLRALVGGLPERQLVDHPVVLPPDAPEVRLGALLARYEVLYKQSLQGAGVRDVDARALVCVSLHKRLLSSVAAFRRTVEVHARAAEQLHRRALHLPLGLPDPDDVDPVDEEQVEDETVSQLSLRPSAEALDVLAEMRRIAAVNTEIPDARLNALATWIRDHLRPDGRWRPTRLVVFTEYDDTLQWMARHLPALLGLPRGDWLATWSGKLNDDSRHELHERFNADPGREPLRVLLATDAAREGLNLQAWCHNLFHFDLPWNPARIEQRNGRIDRTLQPEPVVYCHYLHVQGRVEDRVLAHLVRKVETIHRDLGSLSDVLSARITERLQLGLRGVDEAEIDRLSRPDQAALEAVSALEGRGARGALTGDLALLDRLRQRSEARLGWRPEHLHLLVDQGLKLVSRDGKGLEPTDGGYALPELDESWSPLVDALRGPPPPNAHFKARGKVRPVTVRPSSTLHATAVQLHLGHPIVKRLSALFLSQGWSSSALHRMTVLPSTERVRRVLAFGRLSLFGQGASRLHEELIFVSAQILADGALKPLGERGRETGEATLAELLAAAPGLHPDPRVRYQVLDRASADATALHPLLEAAQEAARDRASALLEARAEAEARAMLAVLDSARQGILDTQARARQRDLFASGTFDRAEQAKHLRDLRDMVKRLDHIDEEREREPARIRAGYKVEVARFQPLGLAYLWPESA